MQDFQQRLKEEKKRLKTLEPLIDKRVEVEAEQQRDWTTTKRTLRGWLHKDEDGSYYLISRINSRKGARLTFGLFNGFYATITIKNIKAL